MKFRICIVFLASMVSSVNAFASIGPRHTAELIADGWVLSNAPAIPASALPDTVCDVEYPWADGGSDDAIWGSAFYLGEEARAWYRFSDEPVFGEISFYVYDKGASFAHANSTYGPRWGVQNNPAPNPIPATGTVYDQMMGVELTAKSFMDANATYAFVNSSTDETSNAENHYTLLWPGNTEYVFGASAGQHAYRRVEGSLPQGVSTYDPADNVQGAWSRWTFSIHDGEDMLFKVTDIDGVSNEQSWVVYPTFGNHFDTGFSTKGFNQVYFYGGNTNGDGSEDHVGLWIDEIQFTPDPGQGASGWSEGFGEGCSSGDGCCECSCSGRYGDFNCDWEVGLLDLDVLGQNWGATDLGWIGYIYGDASGDGEVGLLDLDIVGQYWGQTLPYPIFYYIPEPATLSIITLAIALTIRRK